MDTQFEGTHIVKNQGFRSLIDWKRCAGVVNVALRTLQSTLYEHCGLAGDAGDVEENSWM